MSVSSSTPTYSRSRSPEDFVARNRPSFSDFNEDRLRAQERAHKLYTPASASTLYRRLHTNATESERLHFVSSLQEIPSDFIDNVELVLDHVAQDEEILTSTDYNPRSYFFRNRMLDRNRGVAEFFTVDDQLFQDTGLYRDRKYVNQNLSSIQKSLSKITEAEGRNIPKLSPENTFTLLYACQHLLKVAEASQWLAEEIQLLHENFFQSIKRDLVSQFGTEYPPIRTYDFPAAEKALFGLNSFAQRVAFLSTTPEPLISGVLDPKGSTTEILKQVRHHQRKFPLNGKKQSWRKAHDSINRKPTVQIIKSMDPNDFSVFLKTDKRRRKQPRGYAYGGNKYRFNSTRKKVKQDQQYHKNSHPQRKRSSSQGNFTKQFSRSSRSRSFSKTSRSKTPRRSRSHSQRSNRTQLKQKPAGNIPPFPNSIPNTPVGT